MAAYNKFNTANTRLVTDVNATTDTFKLMLTNTAPVATNSVIADITEITAGNGYTAGGITLDVTATTNGSACDLTIPANPSITASGGAIPTYRYAVIADTTVDALISWYDRGSTVDLADGDTGSFEIAGLVIASIA